MKILILDGNEEAAHDGMWTYETGRLFDEASKRPLSRVDCVHISDVAVRVMDDGECIFIKQHKLVDMPDLVIARAICFERDSHWIEVLRFMEDKGAVCINSKNGMMTVANKVDMGRCLASWNIACPQTISLQEGFDLELIGEELGYPLIVKQAYGTQGSGVAKADNLEGFREAAAMFGRQQAHNPLPAQKFICTSYGRDVRAFVIGDRVVASMLRQASGDEFRSNFSLGGTVRPFELCAEGQRLAVQVTQALGLAYSGVDLLFGDNEFVVCEANKTPGFKGLERAFPDLNIARDIIDFGMRLVQEQAGCRFKPEVFLV